MNSVTHVITYILPHKITVNSLADINWNNLLVYSWYNNSYDTRTAANPINNNLFWYNNNQVSEEIAENDLDDDAEDVVEETDETSPEISEKDNEFDSENDLEEQELAEAVADDGEKTF